MVGSRVRVRDGSCKTWAGRGFRTNVRSAALCDGQATGECSSPRDPGSRVAPSNSRRDPRASSRRGCGQQLAAPQPYRPGQPEISGRDTFATAGRPPSKRLPCGVRVLANEGTCPSAFASTSKSSRQPTGSVRRVSPWCGRRPLPLPTNLKSSRGDSRRPRAKRSCASKAAVRANVARAAVFLGSGQWSVDSGQ